MRGLRLRLYRESRCFAVAAVLTFIGGLLAFPDLDRTLFGLPLQLLTGTAFTVGLTAALAVGMLLPPLRSYAESVALGISVLGLMGGLAPDSTKATASLTLGLALVFVTLARMVYGEMWPDFLVPRHIDQPLGAEGAVALQLARGGFPMDRQRLRPP